MRTMFKASAVIASLPLLGALDPATLPSSAPPAPICHVETKPEDTPPAAALLPGYGTGGFVIAASSPEAQSFFDNGMQLAHAFAHTAAIAAFRRAELLDPQCAMCVWGEAWSRGPTINYRIDGNAQKKLIALSDRAAAMAANGPPKEVALTHALQLRYHDGGGSGPGDEAFAKAMDQLTKLYPDDDDLTVVAADAWMISASHFDRRDHLNRAMALLEGVLKRSPNNTGAIHFYIHASEMSGVGIKALPYAERLEALAPAASHLVHMPSHTYFWAGRYRLAELSNLAAVKIDEADAASQRPEGGVFDLPYHGHNVQFAEGSALMDGDGQAALTLAGAQLQRLSKLDPQRPFQQLGFTSAYFVYGRFAAQNQVAALVDPGSKAPLARMMWRYAKGEAAARSGDLTGVKAQAASMAEEPREFKSLGELEPQAKALVKLARLVLSGRAAMLEGRFDEAASAYGRAAACQETELGGSNDPPIWWYPVRRSLAAAFLAAGRPQEAAAEAQKAMVRWPYDPLSLRILADSGSSRQPAANTLGRQSARRDLELAKANWFGDPEKVPLALI